MLTRRFVGDLVNEIVVDDPLQGIFCQILLCMAEADGRDMAIRIALLPADDDEQAVIEVAIADDEEAAKSWCDAVLTSYTPEMASLMAEEPDTTDGSDPVQDTNAEEPNEPEVTENG